ncbi:hypothetical protein CTI12_AA208820 [Artemisia annua]|uniref:VQ domain-containing protein n=1 Tax=Artemisia annua TaxID=35608 RepID=A0A2U1NZS7_ARTAN|nr:hypothetical protein CTI12_AA208820 [Artemisia annua]
MENTNHNAGGVKREDRGIKVKHISSPVLVEAKDASHFKQIVQHFTGQTPKHHTSTPQPDTQFFSQNYNPSNSSNPKTDIYGYSWK